MVISYRNLSEMNVTKVILTCYIKFITLYLALKIFVLFDTYSLNK